MQQWVLRRPPVVETGLFTPLKINKDEQRIKDIIQNVDSSTYEKQLKAHILITSGPLLAVGMSMFAFWVELVRQHDINLWRANNEILTAEF